MVRPWSSTATTPAQSGVARLVPPMVPLTHCPPWITATPVVGSASMATSGVARVALVVTPVWYAGLASKIEAPPPVPMQLEAVHGDEPAGEFSFPHTVSFAELTPSGRVAWEQSVCEPGWLP